MTMLLKKQDYSFFYLPLKKRYILFTHPIASFSYYKDYRLNNITQEKEQYSIFDFWNRLKKFSVTKSYLTPIVFHFSYEFGYLSEGLRDKLPKDKVLAREIQYDQHRWWNPSKRVKPKVNKIRGLCYEDYEKKFEFCYQNLLAGNAYQINLTDKFEYQYQNFEVEDFLPQQDIPAYAHGTVIQSENWAAMSYSPECLFHLTKGKDWVLKSMPIKGTVKKSPKAFEKLKLDLKEEGELYMITDLLRNDLSKIQKPQSYVVSKKALLELPTLLHQYSDIRVKLTPPLSLFDIVKNIFPGGSITGAPKKNVMKIIDEVESKTRDFYCGSTLVFHQSMRKGSINIRSLEFDLKNKTLSIGAGGGVTLKSEASKEFSELLAKLDSIKNYFS